MHRKTLERRRFLRGSIELEIGSTGGVDKADSVNTSRSIPTILSHSSSILESLVSLRQLKFIASLSQSKQKQCEDEYQI